jgi:hypothetical protein
MWERLPTSGNTTELSASAKRFVGGAASEGADMHGGHEGGHRVSVVLPPPRDHCITRKLVKDSSKPAERLAIIL